MKERFRRAARCRSRGGMLECSFPGGNSPALPIREPWPSSCLRIAGRRPLGKYSSIPSLPANAARNRVCDGASSTQGLALLIQRMFWHSQGYAFPKRPAINAHRFPTEIIRHGKWLYYHLSLWEVSGEFCWRMLHRQPETLRQWCVRSFSLPMQANSWNGKIVQVILQLR